MSPTVSGRSPPAENGSHPNSSSSMADSSAPSSESRPRPSPHRPVWSVQPPAPLSVRPRNSVTTTCTWSSPASIGCILSSRCRGGLRRLDGGQDSVAEGLVLPEGLEDVCRLHEVGDGLVADQLVQPVLVRVDVGPP